MYFCISSLEILTNMVNSTQKTHKPADALDWDEAMRLINRLTKDKRYRDSMLIASGCFLGLRISDILKLKWKDILDDDVITIVEKKTKKSRHLKINSQYRRHAVFCYEQLGQPPKERLLFGNPLIEFKEPISRQRIATILKNIKKQYNVKTAKVFSSHSLRKTFGRRVWNNECQNNRGEMALMLLCEVFNHSNINITKRYLGIRQDEILSVYDSLD